MLGLIFLVVRHLLCRPPREGGPVLGGLMGYLQTGGGGGGGCVGAITIISTFKCK
jgi:hypothetical protein